MIKKKSQIKRKIKLRNKLVALTSIIYHRILYELDGDNSDKEKINKLYIEKVCNLSDSELEFILWGHEKEIVCRTSPVLDAIKKELFERGIFENKK